LPSCRLDGPSRLDEVGCQRSRHEFEDERGAAAASAMPVDAGDVLVIERRENPGLAFESGRLLFVERH
jgi:hypothetical protein